MCNHKPGSLPFAGAAAASGRKLSGWGGNGWNGNHGWGGNDWNGNHGWGGNRGWGGNNWNGNRGWGGNNWNGNHGWGGNHGWNNWGRKLSGFEQAWYCKDGKLVGELSSAASTLVVMSMRWLSALLYIQLKGRYCHSPISSFMSAHEGHEAVLQGGPHVPEKGQSPL